MVRWDRRVRHTEAALPLRREVEGSERHVAPREQPAVGAPVLDSRAIEIQKVPWEAFMEVRIWTPLQAARVMRGPR